MSKEKKELLFWTVIAFIMGAISFHVRQHIWAAIMCGCTVLGVLNLIEGEKDK